MVCKYNVTKPMVRLTNLLFSALWEALPLSGHGSGICLVVVLQAARRLLWKAGSIRETQVPKLTWIWHRVAIVKVSDPDRKSVGHSSNFIDIYR